jgi:hypothetical protein
MHALAFDTPTSTLDRVGQVCMCVRGGGCKGEGGGSGVNVDVLG